MGCSKCGITVEMTGSPKGWVFYEVEGMEVILYPDCDKQFLRELSNRRGG